MVRQFLFKRAAAAAAFTVLVAVMIVVAIFRSTAARNGPPYSVDDLDDHETRGDVDKHIHGLV